jgi:hypothetical protein
MMVVAVTLAAGLTGDGSKRSISRMMNPSLEPCSTGRGLAGGDIIV